MIRIDGTNTLISSAHPHPEAIVIFIYLKIEELGMLYWELDDDGDNSNRLSGATKLELTLYSFFCVPIRGS